MIEFETCLQFFLLTILFFLAIFISAHFLVSDYRLDFYLIEKEKDPEKKMSLWKEYKEKYNVDEHNKNLMEKFGIK